MRVHYKHTMMDKIIEAVQDANRLNKEIDFIVLSRPEWSKLKDEVCELSYAMDYVSGEIWIHGVKVVRG